MRTVGGMVGVAPTAPPHQLATLVAATEAVVMEAATVPPPSYYPPPTPSRCTSTNRNPKDLDLISALLV